MSKLQTIPAGYLSLLGIKDGGNPSQAADFVQPVISLDTFYLATQVDSVVGVLSGATNVGDAATVTVPPGEAWRLLTLGGNCHSVSAPAANIRMTLALLEPRNLQSMPVFTHEAEVVAAGDAIQFGVPFPQPIVVPPGTILRNQLLNDLGAVTFTIEVRAMFQRLIV